jgi:hypothetical protein
MGFYITHTTSYIPLTTCLPADTSIHVRFEHFSINSPDLGEITGEWSTCIPLSLSFRSLEACTKKTYFTKYPVFDRESPQVKDRSVLLELRPGRYIVNHSVELDPCTAQDRKWQLQWE